MKKIEISTFATAGKTACRMLQKGAKGKVIGVFSQGIYAKMGEEILLLHDAKWGVVPFGIAVADIAAFAAKMHPALGDTVILSNAEIRIGDATMPYCLGGHRTEPATCRAPLTKEHLSAIYAYIRTHGSDGGMLALLRENRGNVREKIDALMRGDADAAVGLLGLGRGLTPSGDDFLCGFFSTLDCVASPRFAAVRKAILQNLNRTTDISAAYIKSALRNEYCTVYSYAARAVLDEMDFALPACDFVLEMGASSGTDTLLGALAAATLL